MTNVVKHPKNTNTMNDYKKELIISVALLSAIIIILILSK